MESIINTILIVVLIGNIITELRKIRSNWKVVEMDNKILVAHNELKRDIDKKNKILMESHDTYRKIEKHLEELKKNVSLN